MASNYFKTSEITLANLADSEITQKYDEGYVLTRLGKGVMNQTRSLRVDLSKFKLNSENKRILRKTSEISFEYNNLPLENYSWEIHRMGKEFYEQKGTKYKVQSTMTEQKRESENQRARESDHRSPITDHFGAMSASKIKAMFNDLESENMNAVFQYKVQSTTYEEDESESQRVRESESQRVREPDSQRVRESGSHSSDRILNTEHRILNTEYGTPNTEHRSPIGYCLVYKNSKILHYAYPFYDLGYSNANLGLGMMTRAIVWAKENNLKYVYLGSVTSSASKYKLQFNGLEWFDTREKKWTTDITQLKSILN